MWFFCVWLLSFSIMFSRFIYVIACITEVNNNPLCEYAVLVCLGCYNKISQSGWLISNRNLFLTVLEARSPRWVCQHGQRALFGWQAYHSTLPWWEGPGSSGVSFIRAVMPFMRALPSGPNISQRPHLLILSHWALGFQHMNLGGGGG